MLQVVQGRGSGRAEKALDMHKKKAPLMRRAVFFNLPIYYIDM
jgi:hypothetical protein